jgi:MFS family permease
VSPPPAPERLITPPFLVVTLSTFAFFVFVGMLNPVLPVFIERGLGGGGIAIGAQVAAFSLAAIVIRPVIGPVGDRAGRRVLMLVGSVLAAVSSLALVTVDSLVALLALRAVTGIGEAALFVGAATLIADLSPPHRRAESASYFSVAVFAGLGLGPLAGEALLGADRFDRTFVVAAGFALVAGMIALGAPHGRPAPVSPSPTSAPPVRRRLVHPAAVGPGVVLAGGIAALTTFFVFVPTYVDDLGMAGASGVFLVYSVISLVIRIGFATLPERLGVGRSAGIALSTQALGGVVAALWASPIGLYTGTVFMAVGGAFLYPSLMAAAVAAVIETERSQVISSFTMFFEIGAVVGGLVLGPVVALSDERAAFLGGAGFAVVGLIVLSRWVLRRSVPSSPTVPTGCV